MLAEWPADYFSSWPIAVVLSSRARTGLLHPGADLMDSDDYAADTSGIDLSARAHSALFTTPGT